MMEIEATPRSAVQASAGGPAKVVLLAADRLLLGALRETVEAVDGVELAGAFTSTHQLGDRAMWKHADWQLAFVDFALHRGSPSEAVTHLLAQPHPGEVVALGVSRWPEMQQACASIGVQRILDRGNLQAFRGFLQEYVQHAP